MIDIKFGMRVFIHQSKVCIRVYWEKKKYETTFITGFYAEPKKWDKDLQRAKKNSIHTVKLKCTEHVASALEINACVAQFKEEIEHCFYLYSLKGSIPTVEEVKTMVNSALGRSEELPSELMKKKTLTELYADFIKTGVRERNWDKQALAKYKQAFNQFTNANPKIKVEDISEDSMYNVRDWFVNNGYKNRTINKQFNMIKCFLKYINDLDGYEIPKKCLTFQTNFKVIKRTVTFLHFNELMEFYNYDFENNECYAKVRDLWCFMAFTSLRYSDLSRLKAVHIIDGKRIEMIAEKTDEHLSIPLNEYAQTIIERRGGNYGKNNCLFNVPSNQKMNDYLKMAAKKVGLNREIIDTYFIGTKRVEKVNKFHEIISCHDARRTFVSCSLAMRIPPEVVMKCTGHKGYSTMKPYIETATETQSLEMERWNKNNARSQIIKLLDNADSKQLDKILDEVTKLIVLGENAEVQSEDNSKVLPTNDEKENNVCTLMNALEDGRLIHIEYSSYMKESTECNESEPIEEYFEVDEII